MQKAEIMSYINPSIAIAAKNIADFAKEYLSIKAIKYIEISSISNEKVVRFEFNINSFGFIGPVFWASAGYKLPKEAIQQLHAMKDSGYLQERLNAEIAKHIF